MIERYTRPEMGKIWTLENKFKKWLEIEVLACEAWARLGVIPEESARLIRDKAGFSVDRILEIEQVTRHDVVAFTRAVAETLGEESKYVHYGLTSSDVVDTAMCALMKEAAELIIEDIEEFIGVLKVKALQYKDMVMVGRTHGVHAEPTTFGLKLALWYAEMQRNLTRMKQAKKIISVGKLSGAVGTYAHIDPFVEEYICGKMGLEPAPISTQIIQRDRHGEYLTVLAVIGGTLDKIATEIRGLQKSETREVEEPFYKGQTGSSAMPHKRNPVSCEQVTGLCRIVRSNALTALENIALWHERDISHSSAERVIVPDSTILIDYLLKQMTRVIRDLHVYPENMKRNMERTYGLIYSQRVLLKLVEKGLLRERAYEIVQSKAMEAWEKGVSFRTLLEEVAEVQKYLTTGELDACFDPLEQLKRVDLIFQRLHLA
ncbi:adenylosuccinate lyase [Candidatus Contubernalis alkaliaceticus]|uniref:adenylosuccinate lyase n=1 Tax=Candidatus Contubernalis alkaliaceticus TaxID=338645 RepID=UPI001F4C0775|nr:adenylosuccinate lyase [Candidatus Contubernalis alkalaceticus]UNC91515.1 adenylosuccinate lyase [Candidatus Contubernalis alkalaceticus]